MRVDLIFIQMPDIMTLTRDSMTQGYSIDNANILNEMHRVTWRSHMSFPLWFSGSFQGGTVCFSWKSE